MTDELIANGYELDMTETIPVPITFSIADAKDPSKRKQSFSKQVEIPDTANNNIYFTGAYSITSTENGINFDATAKEPIMLYKRGVKVLDGTLKLDKVIINNGVKKYLCTVLSDSVDTLQLLSTITVQELDWSAYNHILNRTNIKNSWSAAAGMGYYYPLIERGNGRLGTLIWRTTDLYPYVYLHEALKKSFEFIGLVWDSAFLETTQFKNILFGYGGGEIKTIPAFDINQRKVDIDNGDYTDTFGTFLNTSPITANNIAVSRQLSYSPAIWFKNPFQDSVFTSTTTQDLLSQFDNGEIEIQRSGNYTLSIGMVLDYIVNYGTMTFNGISGGQLRVLKNGLLVQTISTSVVTSSTDTGTFDFNVNNSFNLNLQSGDVISFQFRIQGVSCTVGIGVEPQDVTIDLTTPDPITIDLFCIDTTITDGGTVQLGLYLPNMKCSDLLMGVIRQFNLYLSDPDKDGVVKIEPLTDFYSQTSVFTDITKLIDHKKPITIKPSANEYAKNILFTFKKSTDFDATRYEDKWGEAYGDYNITQSSYYAKGEQKTELPWGTIIPYEIATGILVPRFVKIDNNVLKPNAGAPRIMFRNGQKNGTITLRDTATPSSETLTTYPCVHHFDNWQNPTMDLNFKLVNEVYYTATIVTTVNSYSEYYSTFINEIISKAGQFVTASVYWTEVDIKNRDFGKLLMIDGALFRLNLIKEFSTDVQATTEIELIKVLKAKKARRIKITGVAVSPGLGFDTTTSPPNTTGEDVGVIKTPRDYVSISSNVIRG